MINVEGKQFQDIPISILDLAPITEGNTAETTFRNSLKLARAAEALGYKRYWLAEHHNMESVASSATAVLIGYIAGGTQAIRVGSGGIMLPNHAPLVVAEQFGTLASLYPGRIDLGLGRAPGTDQLTAMALRRNRIETAQGFPDDILALQKYFPQRIAHRKCVPYLGKVWTSQYGYWVRVPIVRNSQPCWDYRMLLPAILPLLIS